MWRFEKHWPLFFALDHVNYARWLPEHIRDMKCLPSSIRDELEKQYHWVLSKTNYKFQQSQLTKHMSKKIPMQKALVVVLDSHKMLLHLHKECCQDQSWQGCRNNLKNSICLVLTQTTQGISRTMNRVLLPRKHFESRLTASLIIHSSR